MTTILVIHPYFGKFPNIFPFWLESCKLNKTIDFLIATDQPITSPAPNIHIWNTTLPEIKRRIENITNIPVWLEQPYKLCDFRPLFGQTFNEYTSKYDFWGYCDCDLIFGNIRAFLTEDILSNYDYIMGWGHFHIQRTNDPKFEKVWKTARGLWKNINWKEVFQSNKNEWFDELPHGVSGRYYELYPEKCWMGYKNNHACYESPTPSCLTFRSLFNDYCLWKQWDGYQLHKKRLPFLKRQPGGDLNNAIFYKNNADLYIIGTNENGNIETVGMYGYCTNDAKEAGHFSGRKVAAMFRSIYKKLCPANRNQTGRYISHCNDWWGDGSGDMLFIRHSYYRAFEEWARQ